MTDIANQEVNDQIAGRNSNGTFAKGHNLTLGGNNKGYQPYGIRAKILAARYSPAEIIELADNEKLREAKVSYWDSLCIVHMARALDRNLTMTESGADQVGKERSALLDRVEGTSKQTVEIIEPEDSVNSKERMLDLAMRIAFILRKGVGVKTIMEQLPSPAEQETDDVVAER